MSACFGSKATCGLTQEVDCGNAFVQNVRQRHKVQSEIPVCEETLENQGVIRPAQ